MSTLHIGLILPDVLGTYGDDGNALVLRQRARMRGLDAEIVPVTLGTAVPEQLDVYTVGGGEDTAQILAAEHLINDGGIVRAVNAGRPVLAICAGLQVFGESFRASGRMVDGLGLLDATTSALKERMIGEIASQPNGGGEGYGADSHVSPSVRRVLDALTEPLTGFANHMGATILGSEARPLGTLTRGTGNTDEHGAATAGLSGAEVERQVKAEGVIQGSVIATYMHGPVLARNPQLADALLAEAMGTTVAELPPMTSEFAEQLTAEVRALRRERLH
ncbi:glutamine amidotransferase [Corynebacterium falsenii]|uniref:type 1 glutamine amidotransferase n=1 Tax=Corynebacterium falsenii TaxID=108486 RepID=UPI001CD00DD8|nr:glutamine amidotransferase [Corynebacterium falsenii]UBI07164.1 glutamine amidotransferase [Corynebacterium falsenii]